MATDRTPNTPHAHPKGLQSCQPYGADACKAEGEKRETCQTVDSVIFCEYLVKTADQCEEDDHVHVIEIQNPRHYMRVYNAPI